MYVPALAARAPEGDTYVTIGMGEASIVRMISRMEVSSPPGVSTSNITNLLPAFCASSMPCTT
jgi:hypothetical protein